jgi:hypothetical protein
MRGRIASSSSPTLVKLSRLMRFSEMLRKTRSTMFSHVNISFAFGQPFRDKCRTVWRTTLAAR